VLAQVINHGIPEQVLQDVVSVIEEFFQLPAADKAHFYSEDNNRPNRLFSGSTYKTSKRMYWMDCLRLYAPSPPAATARKNGPKSPRSSGKE
jgi:2'-deoxymugineic-acid 2'-dioxygenase/mugineic-acid 3-dioxygenase